jgi:hypothetical protein
MIAVFWVVVLMILFSFPTSGNISITFMLIVAVALVLYYLLWARTRFKGPQIHGGEAQLSEIEKEFEQRRPARRTAPPAALGGRPGPPAGPPPTPHHGVREREVS